jgi:preprotein translocase subunit SecE
MATEKKELKPAPKKDAGKKEKPKASSRSRKFSFKRTALAIGHFFRDVYFEMKKVTWASRKEFISYTMAVIAFVAVFGLIIFGMDYVLQNVPKYLASLSPLGS